VSEQRSEYYVAGPRLKYGNKKVVIDNIEFDSQLEAARYLELKTLFLAGAIIGLEMQPVFELQPGFRDNTGAWRRAITYKADFAYIENGRFTVEDTKGHETEVWRIKEKLFRYTHPNVDFRILK